MKKQKAKQYSLLHKSMVRFIVFTTIMFTLAIPLFYWLTKNYYAEDMEDIIEAVQNGQSIPAPDLETDVMIGITIQYLLITTMLGIGVVLTMRFISKKLWAPFDDTLTKVESFSLEKGAFPYYPHAIFWNLHDSTTRLNDLCIIVLTATMHRKSLRKMPHTSYKHRLPYSKVNSTCCCNNPNSPNNKLKSFKNFIR